MRDTQFLLLALLVLYLSECLYWVRRGSVVFRTWWGKRGFHAVDPSPGMGGKRTGIVALNPLPPPFAGRGFLCHQWPLSLTPDCAYAYVRTVINLHDRPDHSGYCVNLDNIRTLTREGDTLLINGHRFATLNAESLAERMKRILAKLRAAPRKDRDALIDSFLRRSLDLAAIRRRLRRFHALSSPLRWNGVILFLLLFGAIPGSIAIYKFRHYLLSLLILLAGGILIQCWTFYGSHRRLYPAATAVRWRSLLTLVFTPTASIRAADLLSRDLLADFHPLAAALVLCTGERRTAFVRRLLADMQYPIQPTAMTASAQEQQTGAEFHQRLSKRLFELAKREGYPRDQLFSAPDNSDPTVQSFCPRCRAFFVLPAGTCPNCSEVPLTPLLSNGSTSDL